MEIENFGSLIMASLVLFSLRSLFVSALFCSNSYAEVQQLSDSRQMRGAVSPQFPCSQECIVILADTVKEEHLAFRVR